MFLSLGEINYTAFEVYGNSAKDVAIALGVFVALMIVLKIFQSVILGHLRQLAKKTKTDVDDALIHMVGSVRPSFYFIVSLYLALSFIRVPGSVSRAVYFIFLTWLVYQAVILLQGLINFGVKKIAERDKDKNRESAIRLLGKIAKVSLWLVGLLLLLSNLGFNVSSLLAGLGIGGIAIALALQNILSDLFSSFAIYFDKPFQVGDFIIVGQHMGVVEKIGIKTTRLRALQGEEIVLSNQELVSARVQNFKKMQERRVLFNFGVVYSTPMEAMEKIPSIVKGIIAETSDARFDRCHFNQFDSSALNFEVVYYVKSGDYNHYMDINQSILLAIKHEFEKEKIEMAYPTQTIYMNKQS